jgi:hypothetical protein
MYNKMMSVQMPSGTQYNRNLPQNVAAGRVNTRRYFATNSNATFSFATTNEIRIDVSGDKNTFLNCAQSYLDFSLGAVTANINSLDGGAHSWIQELRIQSMGQDLELISNYNLLHTILIQYTSNVSNLIETNAISGGYRTLNMMPEFATGTSTLVGTTASLSSNVFSLTNTATGQAALTMVSLGGRGNFTPHDTEDIAANTTKQFCIPLISGFMSNNVYLPIGASKGFTIILRLTADFNVGVWAANTGTYTISNISFNVPVINIDDPQFQVSFDGMLRQQGRVSWASQTYRNYVSSVVATGGDQQVILNDRSKSLNAILCCLRSNVVAVSAFDRMSLSCRTIVGVNTFQIRIGDNLYPSNQIVIKANTVSAGVFAGGRSDMAGRGNGSEQSSINVSRAMCEVMKSFRNLHSTLSTGIISLDSYSSDEGLTCNAVGLPTSTTTSLPSVLSHYGAGLLGVDLTTYSGDDDSISGINTAENNLNVTLLFNFQSQAGAAYEVQSFAVCDSVYSLHSDGSFSSLY